MNADLIARLEKAEVGSLELDAEICIALGYAGKNSEGAINIRTDPDWEGDLLFEVGADECCNPIPRLTTSLDAIVGLIGEKLPGWAWEVVSNGSACLFSPDDAEAMAVAGSGGTACFALCIALLKALEAQHER